MLTGDLVERFAMSIKEDQGRTLVVHQTAEYDARRLIHLQTAGAVAQMRLKPFQ